nr:myb family transcription factor phl6 [Quercus suber]
MTDFTEQLELQFLSDELDVAITDHGENPRLEEIYETPQAPTKPAIGLTCNQSCHSVVPTLDDLSSNSSPWSVTLKVMPLPACFVQAVNMPDGAEV